MSLTMTMMNLTIAAMKYVIHYTNDFFVFECTCDSLSNQSEARIEAQPSSSVQPIPRPSTGQGQFANLHLKLNLTKNTYSSYRYILIRYILIFLLIHFLFL